MSKSLQPSQKLLFEPLGSAGPFEAAWWSGPLDLGHQSTSKRLPLRSTRPTASSSVFSKSTRPAALGSIYSLSRPLVTGIELYAIFNAIIRRVVNARRRWPKIYERFNSVSFSGDSSASPELRRKQAGPRLMLGVCLIPFAKAIRLCSKMGWSG